MIKIKFDECATCSSARACKAFDDEIRVMSKVLNAKYIKQPELKNEFNDLFIKLKKSQCLASKTSVKLYKKNENIEKGDIRELLDYYTNKFKTQFNGESPLIIGSHDIPALKVLLKQFSKEKVKFIIDKYLETKDDWLTTVGYSLKHVLHKVNSILVSEVSENNSLDWIKYVSNEQLFEFLRLRQKGEWDPGIDGENLTTSYQNEIVKRGLSKKEFVGYLIKICDYSTIKIVEDKIKNGKG